MNILEEIARSYEGTYIRTRDAEYGPWIPFYLAKVDSHSGLMVGQVVKSPTSVWEPHSLNYHESLLNLDFPNLGYVNVSTHKTAMFISVIPSRQWKKGLQPKTLVIKREGAAKSVDFHTPAVIWNIFNPEYSTGFTRVLAGEAVAISPKIAIDNSGSSASLMYCGEPVGVVEGGVFVLFKVYSHLQRYMSKFAICEVE